MDFIYHHTDPNPKATLEKVKGIRFGKRVGDYGTHLNTVVICKLTERNVTSEQFTKLTSDALETRLLTREQVMNFRNGLITVIYGKRKLTYDRFKFIMEEVLKEPIPNDPEIIHLRNLGRGKDLRGKKFGRLTVLECIGLIGGGTKIHWRCKCECDSETTVNGVALTQNHTQSCGCYQKERFHKAAITNGITHGKCYTDTYRSFDGMKQRCYNENNASYENYGGRGITVCDRWRHSFENFYKDMGDKPEGMSLDRIENDDNYYPGNCCWSTPEEQVCNRRNTIKFDDGTILSRWAKVNDISHDKALRIYRCGGLNCDSISPH